MSLSDTEFAVVQQLVRSQSGQVLEPHRRTLCVLKLDQLAQAEGLAGASEVVGRLHSDVSLRRHAVEVLLNGETSFFRDPATFRVLQSEAIPALLEATSGARPLRIWSAACSLGQEPYSVAMLLREMPIIDPLRVEILATDFSEAALDRAAAGKYSQLEVNRGLPTTMLTRHFERSGRQWIVNGALREQVRFQRVDLTSGELPFGAWDLILLRNVLIYFPLETKQLILTRVVAKLSERGLILFGGSETPLGINDKLVPASFGHGFFRRRDSK